MSERHEDHPLYAALEDAIRAIRGTTHFIDDKSLTVDEKSAEEGDVERRLDTSSVVLREVLIEEVTIDQVFQILNLLLGYFPDVTTPEGEKALRDLLAWVALILEDDNYSGKLSTDENEEG